MGNTRGVRYNTVVVGVRVRGGGGGGGEGTVLKFQNPSGTAATNRCCRPCCTCLGVRVRPNRFFFFPMFSPVPCAAAAAVSVSPCD